MSNEKSNPSVVDQFVSQNPDIAQQGVFSAAAGASLPDAPLGARFVARILDHLLLLPITIALNIWVKGGLSLGVSWLISFLYAGYFYSSRGATLGKMALGIAVVDQATGQRLSFWKGAFRDTIGVGLSGIPLFLGYLLVFFTEGKRALHDFLFQSRVVLVRPKS